MAMPGEMEFYAARSLLPATATLIEHQRAYWTIELGLPDHQARQKSTTELAWLFYRVWTLDSQPWYTFGDLQLRYFQQETGLPPGVTVSDYMAYFFANPPSPGPTVVDTNYFRNPNGSGPYAWVPRPDGSGEAWTRTTEAVSGPVEGVPWQKYTSSTGLASTNILVDIASAGLAGEPIEPGVVYSRSIYVISSVAMTSVGWGPFNQFDAGGVALSGTDAVNTPYPTPSVWVRLTQTLPATQPTAAFAEMWARFSNIALPVGGFIGIAGGKLEEAGAVGDFFSGDTPDAGGFQYDWLGTPNDSVSTKSTP